MVHLELNYRVKLLKYQNYFFVKLSWHRVHHFPCCIQACTVPWNKVHFCVQQGCNMPGHGATCTSNKQLQSPVYTIFTVPRFSYTVFIKLSFAVGGQHHTLLWLTATTLYVRQDICRRRPPQFVVVTVTYVHDMTLQLNVAM